MIPHRVGIDCRLAGVKSAGIGRYVQELVTRLVANTQDISWTLFFRTSDQAKEVLGVQTYKKLSLSNSLRFINIPHYTLREQLLLPFALISARLDLLWVPHFNTPIFYPGKTIITVHDLLWHEYRGEEVTSLPTWIYTLKYRFYKLVVWASIVRASKILVPSQSVKKTLLKYFQFARAKTQVTLEGINSIFDSHSQAEKSNSKELLYVGSLYPHKNVKVIIEALNSLPEYNLSIVSARNIFLDRLKAYVQQQPCKNRVEFKGFVSDTELNVLYSEVFCMVQPSLHEGFGLPVLEAMSAGVPAVVSDIAVFREIYMKGVFYFDSTSASSLAKAIKTLSSLAPAKKSQHLKKAKEIASSYSWEKTTQETLRAINECFVKTRRRKS